ncbi:MAG TPA: hypothetical protein VGD66_09200 [Allosphingosinicella sp.]
MPRFPPFLAAAAVLGLAAPAGAQEAPSCASAAAETARLEAERAALGQAVAEIALGGRRKRHKVTPGEVGGAVAGTAASLLLPFGIGAALSAGVGAAARAGKKKPPPAPAQADPAELVARQQAVDARLAELASAPCAAAAAGG